MEDKKIKGQMLVASMNELAYKNHITRVAAEIYGQKHLLDEYQVRALQVMCKRAAEESEEAWREFVDNVIVYNTEAQRYWSDSDVFPEDYEEEFDFFDYELGEQRYVHKMIWNEDGSFANEFDLADGSSNGFYSKSADLAFEIYI